MADRNRKARALRRHRIRNGLCPLCGRKAYNGGRNCKPHTEYFRIWGRRKYAKELGRAVPTIPDRRIKHGGSGTVEYHAYSSAMGRCTNRRNKRWLNYGGRGIKFKFKSFKQWFYELGLRPTPKHSVDRKNTHGHYAPGNVRWATKKQQANNRATYKAITSFTNKELLAECRRRRLA